MTRTDLANIVRLVEVTRIAAGEAHRLAKAGDCWVRGAAQSIAIMNKAHADFLEELAVDLAEGRQGDAH